MQNTVLFRRLFEKYTSGTCTEQEREQFFALIRQNPDSPLLVSLSDELYAQVLKSENDPGKIVPLPVGKTAISKRIVFRYSVAAAVTIFLFGMAYWMITPTDYKKELAGVIHSTQTAGQDFILLPDSSKVWMNSSTDLRFPKKFAADKREIYLEGEAFLDVTHNDKAPFVIHLPGNISVKVLGTAFNIKAFPDRKQAIVSVQRGKVRVSKGRKVISDLSVGEELRIDIENTESVVQKVDVKKIDAWQSGNLFYSDMVLSDIIKDIVTQKGISIRVENEKLAKTVISTAFSRNEKVEDILSVISSLTDCKIRKEANVYILY